MPDLSGYRDLIILRARFEPNDRAPPLTPPAYEPESVAAPDAAESARLRRIDPPIEAVYPEAWLLGGFAAGRLGLNLLRAVARRVLSPEPGALQQQQPTQQPSSVRRKRRRGRWSLCHWSSSILLLDKFKKIQTRGDVWHLRQLEPGNWQTICRGHSGFYQEAGRCAYRRTVPPTRCHDFLPTKYITCHDI